jgi:hypothetical protein
LKIEVMLLDPPVNDRVDVSVRVFLCRTRALEADVLPSIVVSFRGSYLSVEIDLI